MQSKRNWAELELRDVDRTIEIEGVENLRFITNAGELVCRFHQTPAGDTAILWVFGAGGGLGGPAGGVYERLANEFVIVNIASLQLDYRRPGYLAECVADVLLGVNFLIGEGKGKVVLVGHSFGGAVVISAGAASSAVTAIAALSSQTSGTGDARALSPKPLLLIHGTADEILPDSCSLDIFARAEEPKEIILCQPPPPIEAIGSGL